MSNDLTGGSVIRRLLRFAWPLMLSNMLQIIYNLVDMIVVGRFIGAEGLTAVSNGGDLLNTATLLCSGFCAAGQVLISQQIGAKDHRAFVKTIGTIFSFLAVLSVFSTVVFILLTPQLTVLLNIPSAARGQARQYCICCFCGLFFIFGYNEVAAILRGMGDSRRPFLFILIASGINLLLDLLFVGAFRWGVLGAALATVIGQAVSFLISVVYLYRRRNSFGFDFAPGSFRIDRNILRSLVYLGIPLALQSAAVMFSKLFVASYINAFGVAVAAVSGVGARISSCASIVCNAVGTADITLIGQCTGAGLKDRIRKTVYTSLSVNLLFASVLSGIMLLFPMQVFSLFNQDSEVLTAARSYILISVFNFFGSAVRSPMFSLIQGVGNARLSMIIGWLDGLVCRVLLALLFGLTFGMGIQGFWLGDVVAGYIPFLAGGIYFWSGLWEKRVTSFSAPSPQGSSSEEALENTGI